MMRKVLSIFGVLILAGAILAVGLSRASATANQDVGAVEENLTPIHPGDEGWEVKPYVSTERSETVRGPSQETAYRCVSYLEPLQPERRHPKNRKWFVPQGLLAQLMANHSIPAF
jgi:hypothetical protein